MLCTFHRRQFGINVLMYFSTPNPALTGIDRSCFSRRIRLKLPTSSNAKRCAHSAFDSRLCWLKDANMATNKPKAKCPLVSNSPTKLQGVHSKMLCGPRTRSYGTATEKCYSSNASTRELIKSGRERRRSSVSFRQEPISEIDYINVLLIFLFLIE